MNILKDNLQSYPPENQKKITKITNSQKYLTADYLVKLQTYDINFINSIPFHQRFCETIFHVSECVHFFGENQGKFLVDEK